jgi:hypothetical protein
MRLIEIAGLIWPSHLAKAVVTPAEHNATLNRTRVLITG